MRVVWEDFSEEVPEKRHRTSQEKLGREFQDRYGANQRL